MKHIITFNKKEIQDLLKLAAERNNKTVLGRSRGGRLMTKDGDPHILGVFSEAAVATYLGIQMNTEIYKNRGDKGAPDLVYNGKNIEVKAVFWEYSNDPILKVEVEKFKPNIDYYVLCSVNLETYETVIFGVASSIMVGSAKTKRFGRTNAYPLNYVLSEQDLNDIDTLKANPNNDSQLIFSIPPKVKSTTSVNPSIDQLKVLVDELRAIIYKL